MPRRMIHLVQQRNRFPDPLRIPQNRDPMCLVVGALLQVGHDNRGFSSYNGFRLFFGMLLKNPKFLLAIHEIRRHRVRAKTPFIKYFSLESI